MDIIQKLFEWLARLFSAIFRGGQSGGEPVKPPPDPEQPRILDKPWLKLAKSEIGVKEIPGPDHNPAVINYFRDAGFPEIDNDETAWCSAFANAMIERCGYAGSKSLAARSFLTWGKKVDKPSAGDIVVFWRNSPRSWQGHVGFYVGETQTHIKVLGGNQSNAVNVSEYPKTQLLGYRKPVTAANSRTTRASTLGIVSAGIVGTAVLDSQTQLTGIAAVMKEIGMKIPSLYLIAAVMQIALFAIVIWARYDDMKDKGR